RFALVVVLRVRHGEVDVEVLRTELHLWEVEPLALLAHALRRQIPRRPGRIGAVGGDVGGTRDGDPDAVLVGAEGVPIVAEHERNGWTRRSRLEDPDEPLDLRHV